MVSLLNILFQNIVTLEQHLVTDGIITNPHNMIILTHMDTKIRKQHKAHLFITGSYWRNAFKQIIKNSNKKTFTLDN